MAWMVVRVRGTIHSRRDVIETLHHLHLTRANHATVLPEADPVKGMLTRVQGYITWGEADPEAVELLLRVRGETTRGERLTETNVGEALHATGLPEVSRRVSAAGMSRVPGLKPLFRLKAPKGGWRSTKRAYTLGGALGYRGPAINDLVRRMV